MSDDVRFDDLLSPGAARSLAYGRLDGPLEVVPTGIETIDRSMWYWGGRQGVPYGEYVIVGGASSIGKTQLGLYLLKQASRAAVPSGIVSLEMKREDIQLRLAQSWVDIPLRSWEPGRWGEQERTKILEAQAEVRGTYRAPVLINDRQSGTLDWVLRALGTLLGRGVRFIVLDHLQLVKVPGEPNIAMRAEVVSEAVRDWAFTHDVTLIALSQLKRTAAEDFTRSPSIHDLLGGTALESNASQIWLLDHSRYEKDRVNKGIARTWIGHGKNRMGPSRYWVPVEVDHAKLEWGQAHEQEEPRWPRHEKN